jgi:hypothetical protein
MNLVQSLESHCAAFFTSAEEAEKAVVAKFLDFVRGEEAKVKAEIEHLTSRGFTVTPPAQA